MTVEEKKATVESSGRLPCIVFADFVFSSVLSDKFCFCLENKHWFNIRFTEKFRLLFQIFTIKREVIDYFFLQMP